MTSDGWRRGRDTWERLGAQEPYFAVCSHPEYLADAMDDEGRRAFFASGEADIARTLADVRERVDPAFAPASALDFGCGVGRLVIPLASRCARVVGVDVARPMLEAARENCARHGAPHAELVQSGPPGRTFAAVTGEFDFIHSYIVFQHIAPSVGWRILDELLDRLRPSGVGALHFTFAWRASPLRRVTHRIRRRIPPVNALLNVVQRRPIGRPIMPMYQYDLDRVMTTLWSHGCSGASLRFEDHAGHLGAMVMFRKGAAGEPAS